MHVLVNIVKEWNRILVRQVHKSWMFGRLVRQVHWCLMFAQWTIWPTQCSMSSTFLSAERHQNNHKQAGSIQGRKGQRDLYKPGPLNEPLLVAACKIWWLVNNLLPQYKNPCYVLSKSNIVGNVYVNKSEPF